jgi:hypothetical protein
MRVAETNKKAAVAQQKLAETQRDRAERNLAWTNEAVNGMFFALAHKAGEIQGRILH